MADDVTVRQARPADHETVAAFTEGTWADRPVSDYVPRVFPAWVASDDADQRTVVAEREGEVVGLCQGTLLSAHEAWAQGIRVAPAHRGAGVARALNEAVLAWAADRGATVCRNLAFSWNDAGLATARSLGYDPVASFRWAHPDPDADAEGPAERATAEDPAAAWTRWTRSDARATLADLGLSLAESWALQEVTPETLRRAAASTRLLAVGDGDRTRGLTYRVRDYEREADGDRWAEYGVAAWDDDTTARALFAAVARDAAAVGADRTRVLVPETPRHVAAMAAAGVPREEAPDFVFEADLTGR
ncbi:MAG: N-acetyltransferase family protein [Halorientalis sp.]